LTGTSRNVTAANAVPAEIAAIAPTQVAAVSSDVAQVPAASDAAQVSVANTKTAAVQWASLSAAAEILARGRLTV
jgi:hypothetical protein